MEKRDYLMDQIEKVGKVLAKVLSGILNLKSEGKVSETIEFTERTLQKELDIKLDDILTLPKEDLKTYLGKRNLTETHLETLSRCMEEIGKPELDHKKTKGKVYLQKAIDLLEIADEISKSISFDRLQKKNELERHLS